MQSNFESVLSKIYYEQFIKYGANPEGSFWVSKTRQDSRFKIIIDEICKINKTQTIDLSDVGCGYGALVTYIKSSKISKSVEYSGYDISEGLINQCKQEFKDHWVDFSVGTYPNIKRQYCVMSGTYNMAATVNIGHWENYVLRSLFKCWQKTSKAMVFNLQVAKKTKITKEMIFYAEKDRILNFCVSSLGPTKLVTDKNLPNDVTFVVIR